MSDNRCRHSITITKNFLKHLLEQGDKKTFSYETTQTKMTFIVDMDDAARKELAVWLIKGITAQIAETKAREAEKSQQKESQQKESQQNKSLGG